MGAAGSCHAQGYDGHVTTPTRLSLAASLATLLFVAACGAAVPTSTSSGASPSGDAPPTSTAGPETAQTDTDWGRIWDGVPEAFPVYPGATPADDAAREVASATFVLDGADAQTVAGWMQTELERALYATEALNGPLEDGSFVLDLAGARDCRIQVAIAPLGGLTTVNVRYGASCPAP